MKSRINNPELRTILYEQPGKIGRQKDGELKSCIMDAYFRNPDILNEFEEWKAAREKRRAEQKQPETAA